MNFLIKFVTVEIDIIVVFDGWIGSTISPAVTLRAVVIPEYLLDVLLNAVTKILRLTLRAAVFAEDPIFPMFTLHPVVGVDELLAGKTQLDEVAVVLV